MRSCWLCTITDGHVTRNMNNSAGLLTSVLQQNLSKGTELCGMRIERAPSVMHSLLDSQHPTGIGGRLLAAGKSVQPLPKESVRKRA